MTGSSTILNPAPRSSQAAVEGHFYPKKPRIHATVSLLTLKTDLIPTIFAPKKTKLPNPLPPNLIKPNQTKFFSPIRAAGIRCFAPVPPKGDRMNRIYRIKKSRRESSCSSCLSCNPVSIGLWFFAVWCHCVRTSRRPSAIPHSAFTRLAAPPQSR